MLYDLKETYIRPPAPSFISRALPALRLAAIWGFAVSVSLALMWTSLKFGEVSAVTDFTP